MDVRNKAEFRRLWDAGAFGNRLRSWNSITELYASGYYGSVTLRYLSGTIFNKYNVDQDQIPSVIGDWVSKGADPRLIWANESAPDERLTMQGEAMLFPGGWHLFVSREQAKMRDALDRGITVTGLIALEWLRHFMWPSSLSDFEAIFELYPNSIVEFSCYEHALGSVPGRNTIIWEVRNY